MKFIPFDISIPINSNVYLKDPRSSALGKRIVTGSIDLLDEIGFESFTFRKLAHVIDSTEASIYRYFESKHKLLIYLTSWYWGWMEYQLVFRTVNIASPAERLKRAISLITEPVIEDSNHSHIDEVKLNGIVITDSSKAYLTKHVDEENRSGAFAAYKSFVARISEIILEINPEYKYSHMLASTIIEGAHHQRFFADHLPKLTDVIQGEDAITEFYKHLSIKSISTIEL